MELNIEIFKSIKGYEGLYEISNYGRVKSLKKYRAKQDRIMKLVISTLGYSIVSLSINGKTKIKRVHQLIAIAFIDNPENKPQVNHINGIKTDNRIENLEWATAKENTQHSFKTGLQLSRKGIKHHNTNLTENDILSIRKSKLLQKELASIYKISQQTISSIKNKKLWQHI